MKGAYRFNDTITFEQIGTAGFFTSKLPFLSNNIRFNSILVDITNEVIKFNNVEVYNRGWKEEEYKVITFFGEQVSDEYSPSKEEFISWVKANATKITLENTEKVTLRNSKEDGTPGDITIYPKTLVTSILNADGTQWIPPESGSGSIGGGGGGSGSPIYISTITPTSFSTSLGSKVRLSFAWNSSADGAGSISVEVNGTVRNIRTVNQGTVQIDVSSYLTSASDYSIRLILSDSLENKRVISYQIAVISLTISSSFDQTIAKSGSFEYRYTPIGTSSMEMHFVLDDEETTEAITSPNVEQVKTFSGLTHGAHTLVVYATAVVGETTLSSNELRYKFAYYVSGNNSPIIVIFNEDEQEFNEGQIVNINYLVYNNSSLNTNVVLDLNNSRTSLTVDRKLQTWSIRDYEIGENTAIITATLGSSTVTKTIHFNIIEFEEEILPIGGENLKLFLSSTGKNNNLSSRNEWTYGNYSTTFTNFNWISDGWQQDKEGLTALRLTSDARISINYQPFADDSKTNGKTIELEFSTNNVFDFNTTVLSVMSEGKGIIVKPTEMIFKVGTIEVVSKFKQDEHIRISLVIEKDLGNKFIKTYINGILSGVVTYTNSTIFSQENPVNITAGSSSCDLNIYKIRVYTTDLNYRNILNNYIADNDNYNEKLELISKNDIYDNYNNVLFTKVKEIMPVFIITGPQLPTEKGQEFDCHIELQNNFNSTLNFSRDVKIKVQGTSSLEYPYKNFQFAFEEGEQPVQLYNNAIEENHLTLKADYASSSGVYNMGNAKIVNKIYEDMGEEYLNPRQKVDARVRNSLYGYPVAVFYRKTLNDSLQFYYKGSLNLSKEAKALGYQGADESWSTETNTNPLCLFQTADFDTYDISQAFDARYPEEPSYDKLKTLITWVVSCKNNPTKFRDECEDHFNKEYLLMYYVYGQIMGGADSYAKNMYLAYFEQDQRWYPQFYDLDTSFGINNQGELKFPYNVEFSDDIDDKKAFNGANSLLWQLVEQAFESELRALYYELRSKNVVTYDKIMNVLYDDGIAYYPEAIYNEDEKTKYLDTYPEERDALSTALGSTYEYLKYWVYNRLKYLDSKERAPEYISDAITGRITYVEGSSKTYAITMKSYADMYMGIYYASKYLFTKRTNKNTAYVFDPVAEGIFSANEKLNDTETSIYGASAITKIEGLHNWYLEDLDISKAISLTEIKIGSNEEGYSNTFFKEVKFGSNKLLKLIDIRNCPNLVQPIDVSQCELLEEFYASGTGIESVNFFRNGGNLKIVDLPNSVTKLELVNQNKIVTFNAPLSYQVIIAENTNIDILPYVRRSINEGKLTRIRVSGINWNIDNSEMLDYIIDPDNKVKGFDENFREQEKPIINGRIHVKQITQNQLNRYSNYWGVDLTITYDEILPEYIATFKNDEDDETPLYTVGVMQGRYAKYKGATPTKEADNNYSYEFGGWIPDPASVPMTEDATFIASYNLKRKYEVKWVNLDGTVLDVQYIEQNSSATYSGTTPTMQDNVQYKNYEFIGWDKSTTLITQNIVVTARYTYEIQKYPVYWYVEGVVVETDSEVPYGSSPTYNGDVPQKTGYSFYGWSKIENDTNWYDESEITVTGITRLYAIFGEIDGITLKVRWDTAPTSNIKLPIRLYGIAASGFDYSAEYFTVSWGDGVEENYNISDVGLNRLKILEHTYENYQANTNYEIKIIRNSDNYMFSWYNNGESLSEYISSSIREISINTYLTHVQDEYIFRRIYNTTKIRLGGRTNYFAADLISVSDSSMLAEIEVDDNNKNYISLNNVLYSKDYTNLIMYPPKKVSTSYEISSLTKEIKREAFLYCRNLTSITIPNSVETIGNRAFRFCNKLESISIGNSVKEIPEYAFDRCTSLKNVTFPDSVTIIGSGAFYDCTSLTNIIIGNGTETIAGSAFQGCTSLTNIEIGEGIKRITSYAFYISSAIAIRFVCKAIVPPTISSNTFNSTYFNATNGCQVIVPTISETDYEGATDWTTYADIIEGGAENV